jgi:hypothetical protein
VLFETVLIAVIAMVAGINDSPASAITGTCGIWGVVVDGASGQGVGGKQEAPGKSQYKPEDENWLGVQGVSCKCLILFQAPSWTYSTRSRLVGA